MATPKNRAQELQARFGNTVSSAQVNEYIADVGIRYSTITKQLKKYKVPNTKGQWNLASLATQREALEHTFQATADLPTKVESASIVTEKALAQNLVPLKDSEFVPFGNFNDITQQNWRLHPENGMIVIFPSQIIHNVEKNLTEHERYAVAFDVFIRGTFGDYGGSAVTIK